MKRSNMVDMIAGNLYSWYGMDIKDPKWEDLDSFVKEHYEEQASLLLALIENNGMLPPSVNRVTFRDIEGWPYSQKIYEWEPEEDKSAEDW